MAKMDVKEMHKRLMLYKMVRQVAEKQKSQEFNTPWLSNLSENQSKIDKATPNQLG